jgi:fused signal recognition particle receptor
MFSRIKEGLTKTIASFQSLIPTGEEKLTHDTLEEILLEADVGYEMTQLILEQLPSKIDFDTLNKVLLSFFATHPPLTIPTPFVRLIVGINGAGKTTTIAKLTKLSLSQGRSVVLGAGDTFRAAAVEQLTLWASKLNVPIIANKQGADPSSVAFDTINSTIAKKYDECIIDTAGRLHTQTNLGEELKKIVRICDKALVGSPHQKILVLDGTQGQSAIAQAQAFHEMISLDGVIITKLDGTAKGGALFAIANATKLPILYIGMGEKEDDLIPFDPQEFVKALISPLFGQE